MSLAQPARGAWPVPSCRSGSRHRGERAVEFAADVDAATTNGSIKTDLPVTARSIGDNSLRGTINGGGTLLRLRTTKGGSAIRTLGEA